jgi:hypothetical protein
MISCRRVRWAGHVARMAGKGMNTKLNKGSTWWGNIISNIKEIGCRNVSGFIWLMIITGDGLLWK